MKNPSLVLVSACLAGERCRYDGGSAAHPEVQRLVGLGRAVAVCPELLGGLSAPREPVELAGGRALCPSGRDVTAQFRNGARKCLELALEMGCTRAILKSRSPSCGVGRIYDGTFSKRLIPGDGVLAALLKEHGIAVESDEEL